MVQFFVIAARRKRYWPLGQLKIESGEEEEEEPRSRLDGEKIGALCCMEGKMDS